MGTGQNELWRRYFKPPFAHPGLGLKIFCKGRDGGSMAAADLFVTDDADGVCALLNRDLSKPELLRLDADARFRYEEGGLIMRTLDGKTEPYLRIRGWGALTGSGGYALEPADAAAVQDSFGDYVLGRLDSGYMVNNIINGKVRCGDRLGGKQSPAGDV